MTESEAIVFVADDDPSVRTSTERLVRSVGSTSRSPESSRTAERTIKFHRAHIMQKMEAASLADLVRMAGQLGIAHKS